MDRPGELTAEARHPQVSQFNYLGCIQQERSCIYVAPHPGVYWCDHLHPGDPIERTTQQVFPLIAAGSSENTGGRTMKARLIFHSVAVLVLIAAVAAA
ncbi:MAG: hypothetical protein WA354_00320 [Terracidiphilus sp.]